MAPPPPVVMPVDPSPTSPASTLPSATTAPHLQTQLTSVLAGAILVWYCFIWAVALLGLQTAWARYRSRPAPAPSSLRPKPGVSVLRPLKGLDPNLYDNLLSSCTQEYDGPLELIFSVASAEDPSIRVVEELINRFGGEAGRDFSLIVGDTDLGPNPKLNNLYQPFNKAKYDLLYVLDSGILLASPQHLARSVDAFLLSPSFEQQGKRRVSLVHHVPFAVIPPPGNRGLGSWLERAFLNTNHAKMYLAINRTEIDSCVMGKSNFYRRSDVQNLTPGRTSPKATSTSPSLITGLPSFSPYLAEDNMLALSLMHQLKTRHVLASHDVALNHIGAMSFADYFWRRVRWIRVRKEMTKVATLLEPFTESVVVGALVAWAAPFPIWLTLIGHFVGWATVDFLVLTSLAPDPAAELAELPHLILAYAARELLALPVWTVAMLGSDVVWRGRRFRVLPDGKAKEVQEPVGATRPRGRFGRWCHGVASGGGEYTSLQRDETS